MNILVVIDTDKLTSEEADKLFRLSSLLVTDYDCQHGWSFNRPIYTMMMEDTVLLKELKKRFQKETKP